MTQMYRVRFIGCAPYLIFERIAASISTSAALLHRTLPAWAKCLAISSVTASRGPVL